MKKLRERMGRERISWVPEKAGDAVIGEVVEVTEQVGDYGPFLMVTLYDPEQPGKEFVVRGYGSVLAGHLARLAPKDGDVLAITFNGEKESRNKDPKGKPRTYRDFSVNKLGASTAAAVPDFETLAKAAAVQAEEEGIVDDDGNPF